MSNLITLSNGEAVVTMNTLVEFSDNTYDAITKRIRDYKQDLIDMGMHYKGDLTETDLLTEALNYSELVFDERSAMFFLTLLKNTTKIVEFKKDLINNFFEMRDQIEAIRLTAVEDKAKKQIAKVKAAASKVRIYDDGTTSLTGLVQHYDFDCGYETIKNALIYANVLSIKPKITVRNEVNKEYEDIIYTMKSFQKEGASKTSDYAYYPKQTKTLVDRYIAAGSPDVQANIKAELEESLADYIANNL